MNLRVDITSIEPGKSVHQNYVEPNESEDLRQPLERASSVSDLAGVQ